MVKRLQGNPFLRKHVVEESSGLYGLLGKLIECGMPVGIGDEQRGLVGQIRLNEDLFVAGP